MLDLEEYNRKYGDVPIAYADRFIKMMKDLKYKEKDIKTVKERLKIITGMQTEELTFIILMEPKATPRPRISKFGTFYVKGAKDNSNFFKEFLNATFPEMNLITTPTKLYLDLYVPIPSGMGKIDKLLAEMRFIKVINKPDWDNLGKTYSDMIQKHLLQEDSLIYESRVRKFYSSKPRIEMKLVVDMNYDCNYSKKTIEKWKTYETEKAIDRDVI